MSQYDFIFAGGGAAGLSLAYHLLHSPLQDRSILIVDRDAKQRNDRTFAFWTDRPTLFDDIVHRSWDQLRFVGDSFAKVIPLGAFRYQVIRGIDFYRFIRRELAPLPNVEFLHGRVDRVDDGAEGAGVWVEGQMHTGRWVFDSRFSPAQLMPDPARYHYLGQHFQGWVIETPDSAFDPQIATFLDFRTPQKDEMRFFYVLPFSESQALVEYVLFSRDDCEQTLKDYLVGTLGIKAYRIVAREGGVNPLTDRPFPRRLGRRIMAIGTLGGMVKPSSGYAFTRIQADSAAIVRSLLHAGHPFDVPASPQFYRTCDALMLNVMACHGDQAKPIFTAMFKNNPIERILRFLDETTSPRENLAMMASLPAWLFVRAWFELKVLRKVYRPLRRKVCFHIQRP
jgi:lycopene beta-cyclase